MELKYWQHPADDAKIIEAKEHKDQIIRAYTEGSKTEQHVGSGVAIFVGKELAVQKKSR